MHVSQALGEPVGTALGWRAEGKRETSSGPPHLCCLPASLTSLGLGGGEHLVWVGAKESRSLCQSSNAGGDGGGSLQPPTGHSPTPSQSAPLSYPFFPLLLSGADPILSRM